MLDNAEFSFHVHKLTADARRPALFTIAIWEGTVLRSICYAQPLDAAFGCVSQDSRGMGKGGNREGGVSAAFGSEVTAAVSSGYLWGKTRLFERRLLVGNRALLGGEDG